MLSLENFYIAAKKVKEIIDEDKYPEITDVLENSLRTREFLSLYSIRDLVIKIVRLFQYACNSNDANFNIYAEVNNYLDTLLYTYAGTSKCRKMMLDEYDKVPGFSSIKAYEYNKKLELMPISIFNGFKSYIEKVFNVVVNNECDSCALAVETSQNFKFDYRYEFKDIENLRVF